MANRERRKGLDGEREVAAIWREHGFHVHNLEGQGDMLVSGLLGGEQLHVEVKRHETTRPWAWYEQAELESVREHGGGPVPVVPFRRSRSPWLAVLALEDLARLLA